MTYPPSPFVPSLFPQSRRHTAKLYLLGNAQILVFVFHFFFSSKKHRNCWSEHWSLAQGIPQVEECIKECRLWEDILALGHTSLALRDAHAPTIKLFSSQSSEAAANCWLLIGREAAAWNVSNSSVLFLLTGFTALSLIPHDSQALISFHRPGIKRVTWARAAELRCSHSL